MPNAASFSASIELGNPAGPLHPAGTEPRGLTSLGAEVHPIIRYHGPASADPTELAAQTDSLNGGCQVISGGEVCPRGAFLCYDPQAAILAPLPTPEDFVTVTFSKTAALPPNDPNAVWEGTGTTDSGDEVAIRAFRLGDKPSPKVKNSSPSTTSRLRSLELTLTCHSIHRPVYPVDAMNGEIFINGSRQSTLSATTVNGLVTTMGTVYVQLRA